mmetsp:Transcript_40152/g.123915  ORF Transcript_40152/g.123915 Transcript_40152/m.123915 type:complete len:252 (-) Transcript_40152:7-762(-)
MRAAASPTATEPRPTMAKATRQPWMPASVRLPRFVPRSVPSMVPAFMANCMQPNTRPRRHSEVTSATTPLAMGFKEASMTPLKARRTIIGPSWSTKAKTTVMRPWTTQPTIISVFRRMMPRSAMTPQHGAARFWARTCTSVMSARSFRERPKSTCKAKNTHGNITVSAPSKAPTAHRVKSSCQPGILTSARASPSTDSSMFGAEVASCGCISTSLGAAAIRKGREDAAAPVSAGRQLLAVPGQGIAKAKAA